jgi:hypothetical protein
MKYFRLLADAAFLSDTGSIRVRKWGSLPYRPSLNCFCLALSRLKHASDRLGFTVCLYCSEAAGETTGPPPPFQYLPLLSSCVPTIVFNALYITIAPCDPARVHAV